jgi:hypothetical protein
MAYSMKLFGSRSTRNHQFEWALLPALALFGCQQSPTAGGDKSPANLHVALNDTLANAALSLRMIPVPPEDGKKLAPLAMGVAVRARPDRTSSLVGLLRVGSRVARSEQIVSREGCSGGWYAIRPIGFVCSEQDVTTDLQHPIARAITVEPDRTKPMPYRYGFLRAIAPNYLRVPSVEEQYKYETRLERHLRNWKKLSATWDQVEPGANDVPLDSNGMAQADEHPQRKVTDGDLKAFPSVDGDRIPWWLSPRRQIPNLSNFKAPEYAVIANRLKRHAGVALVGSFLAGSQTHERRFAITTDARLIPADKIKPYAGSSFHGQDLRKVGLPIAFVRSKEARSWRLENGRLLPDERINWREFVALSGVVNEFRGKRMVKARDGRWLESEDLLVAANPSSLPLWSSKNVHWIDVGIINQVMVLWEGQRPIYATLVSTGRDGLGDPQTTHSTPVGTFRIYQKHITSTMDSDVADEEFELRDVPWVMYFKGGFALHGAYWHNEFGRARSHGCVNLSPIDARLVFQWSSPQVPEHWHSVTTGSEFEDGTLVNIHP